MLKSKLVAAEGKLHHLERKNKQLVVEIANLGKSLRNKQAAFQGKEIAMKSQSALVITLRDELAEQIQINKVTCDCDCDNLNDSNGWLKYFCIL